MPDTQPDYLAENHYYDAQQVAEQLDREFVDADILQYKQQGIDLYAGAVWFIQHYEGKNTFVLDMKYRLSATGIFRPITQPQARVCLNVMHKELGLTSGIKFKDFDCLVCHEKFGIWDELVAHRADLHQGQTREEPVAEVGDAERVIEVQSATIGLDLSNLPDGRYAAPDPSGKNSHIYLMVKRVRRTHNRDRRYVYGKIVTGNEIVVAGTIEVKIWSSDSKELIGEQKPGEVYRGKYEKELQLIMLMPEPFALLFGKLVGHCCICGKTLTDDISRQIGMGLECEKKESYFRKPPKYTYKGEDRPDKYKADPNDERYLRGELRHYIKFTPTGGDDAETEEE